MVDHEAIAAFSKALTLPTQQSCIQVPSGEAEDSAVRQRSSVSENQLIKVLQQPLRRKQAIVTLLT
jgi:hypothetical protein